MKLVEITGDLFDSKCDVICHQVNCQGAMGAGLAKAIKFRFPRVYEQYITFLNSNYVKDISGKKINTSEFLGLCQLVKVNTGVDKYVANLFGQDKFGKDGQVYTDYQALKISLYSLKRLILFGNYGIKSLAFPYGMGAVLAGGDWNIVYDLIKEVFNDLDITIEIHKLN